MKLKDTFIKQVKYKGGKTGEKYSDGGGLYLHVKETGKYWRMAYRMHGKQKTLAIGVYPAVSLTRARDERKIAEGKLADGIDPNEAKKLEKLTGAAIAANTVEAVALEWMENNRPNWSETHYTRESRNIRKDLVPWLGKRPIGQVTPPELLAVIRKVEDRGALDVAHRVLITASGVWAYAIATGRSDRNICLDIKGALKPHLRKNLPALVEPKDVGELLRACHGYKGGPVVRTALQLAPILFQRPGNLRTMRWADLDLERALWTIPSEDMKRKKVEKVNGQPHVVSLPRQAVVILRDLHPLTGHREYVFPGLRDPQAPMSEASVTAALRALGYQGRQSWHGFRATGRTMLRQVLKYPVDVIEAQLAHKGQITHGGAYDRATHLEERTDMLQEWADYLDKLRMGADVIQFKAA